MITSVATTALTQFLDIGGTRFAYRRFGTPAGTPLVFAQHFMGNLDNFDPAINDALALGREIILFDNAVERFVRRVIDFLDVQPHDTATAA